MSGVSSLIITITCEDGPTLEDERRDEILSAFVGAARKLGLDGIKVAVDSPASALMSPHKPEPYNVTERYYEQAAWDKRHGRV